MRVGLQQCVCSTPPCFIQTLIKSQASNSVGFAPPPDMNQISTRILLLLFSFSSLVVATNFTRCLEDFKKNPDAVGGVDSQGHPTNSTAAIGFTYKACTEQCGSSPAAFNWREFSQLFCAWLLPWLALLSQLPFGSGNLLDDFTSSESSFRSITSPVAYRSPWPYQLS